jgi:hypothetical protein
VVLHDAGSMALLLGLVGICKSFSYSVSPAHARIGIRMAVGAQQAS